MSVEELNLVVLAGPNGAGKSTMAPTLLKGTLGVTEFVNADVIARGLSGFAPAGAAVTAGRIMLRRLRELARRRVSFAFESTLASRLLAPWIAELVQASYRFHLVFLWLRSAAVAMARVAARVRLGGHDVPAETVRRRYHKGLRNFFQLYMPLAATWRMYDNSGASPLRLIAAGKGDAVLRVADHEAWDRIRREYRSEA